MGALAVVSIVFATATALADDDFAGATIVFARNGALYRADPRGKNEAELAKLPADATVRALRTDAEGKVLLVDLGGTWSWMALDGSASALSPLPCLDGPAQLAEDTACVLCRADKGSVIVHLPTGKATPVDVPASPGMRIVGLFGAHRLVWADASGVWSAPPGTPKQATKVVPEPPLRGFLPSPDGKRGLGVYADEVFTDAHHKQPADVLMTFQLDGQAARRKTIQTGVPVEWSHDSEWALVQDGASACLVKAAGGEYKCWKGYTAASIADGGKFALLLGNRDGSKKQTPAKAPEREDADGGTAAPDVYVAPPAGPLALYRVRLEGSPYTESPALVTKIVDGAAVWIPGPKP
jgi:hypothetical protein